MTLGVMIGALEGLGDRVVSGLGGAMGRNGHVVFVSMARERPSSELLLIARECVGRTFSSPAGAVTFSEDSEVYTGSLDGVESRPLLGFDASQPTVKPIV